jgi:hypothetical protein
MSVPLSRGLSEYSVSFKHTELFLRCADDSGAGNVGACRKDFRHRRSFAALVGRFGIDGPHGLPSLLRNTARVKFGSGGYDAQYHFGGACR